MSSIKRAGLNRYVVYFAGKSHFINASSKNDALKAAYPLALQDEQDLMKYVGYVPDERLKDLPTFMVNATAAVSNRG